MRAEDWQVSATHRDPAEEDQRPEAIQHEQHGTDHDANDDDRHMVWNEFRAHAGTETKSSVLDNNPGNGDEHRRDLFLLQKEKMVLMKMTSDLWQVTVPRGARGLAVSCHSSPATRP